MDWLNNQTWWFFMIFILCKMAFESDTAYLIDGYGSNID